MAFDAAANAASDAFTDVINNFDADFNDALGAFMGRVEQLIADKETALADEYETIKGKIWNIYDYHLKEKLQWALDEANDEAAAVCAQFRADMETQATEARTDRDDHANVLTQRFDDNQNSNQQACSDANDEQFNLFNDFTAQTGSNWSEFLGEESELFEANIKAIEWKFQEAVSKTNTYPVYNGYGHYGYGHGYGSHSGYYGSYGGYYGGYGRSYGGHYNSKYTPSEHHDGYEEDAEAGADAAQDFLDLVADTMAKYN